MLFFLNFFLIIILFFFTVEKIYNHIENNLLNYTQPKIISLQNKNKIKKNRTSKKIRPKTQTKKKI
jgi:hypothetical protein